MAACYLQARYSDKSVDRILYNIQLGSYLGQSTRVGVLTDKRGVSLCMGPRKGGIWGSSSIISYNTQCRTLYDSPVAPSSLFLSLYHLIKVHLHCILLYCSFYCFRRESALFTVNNMTSIEVHSVKKKQEKVVSRFETNENRARENPILSHAKPSQESSTGLCTAPGHFYYFDSTFRA